MRGDGRPVLLVNRGRAPDRVRLIRIVDETLAHVRFRTGGWMIVNASDLIDPPEDTITDRATQLDLVIRGARHTADEMTVHDERVLAAFDAASAYGLTVEELYAQLSDTPGLDPDEVPAIADRHAHAGHLAVSPTHRRTRRGRAAMVRHITALGRLVLALRHEPVEVPT